jgi:hypothetical protein
MFIDLLYSKQLKDESHEKHHLMYVYFMITFVFSLISQHFLKDLLGGGVEGCLKTPGRGVPPHIAQWTNKHLVQISFVASEGHGEPAPTSAP